MLYLGVRNLKHRDRPPNTARAQKLADAKWREFLAVGVVVMLTNVTTLVLFAPALHMIVAAPIPTGEKFLAYLLLFAITMSPLLLPLAVAVAMGKKAEPVLSSLVPDIRPWRESSATAATLGEPTVTRLA